jgi:hypothetical protein
VPGFLFLHVPATNAPGRPPRGAAGWRAWTRHQRLATRFLIRLLQRYGRVAPAILRGMANELEGLGEEEGEDPGRLDLHPPPESAKAGPRYQS